MKSVCPVCEPKRYETVRYEKGDASKRMDLVQAEVSVDIYLCDTRLVTLQATPNQHIELAVGFLLSEGLLEDISEYDSSSVDAKAGSVRVECKDKSRILSRLLDRGEVVRTSGCGRGTSFGGYNDIPRVSASLLVSPIGITKLMSEMLKGAVLHNACGGVHCSALARSDRILFLSEDIGRHNTIDKILGRASLDRIGLSDCLVLTTGRISSEMVAKCARLSVPVIGSLTCPTDMAVEIANKLGVTVIGYVRGKRLTVYSHRERVGG